MNYIQRSIYTTRCPLSLVMLSAAKHPSRSLRSSLLPVSASSAISAVKPSSFLASLASSRFNRPSSSAPHPALGEGEGEG